MLTGWLGCLITLRTSRNSSRLQRDICHLRAGWLRGGLRCLQMASVEWSRRVSGLPTSDQLKQSHNTAVTADTADPT